MKMTICILLSLILLLCFASFESRCTNQYSGLVKKCDTLRVDIDKNILGKMTLFKKKCDPKYKAIDLRCANNRKHLDKLCIARKLSTCDYMYEKLIKQCEFSKKIADKVCLKMYLSVKKFQHLSITFFEKECSKIYQNYNDACAKSESDLRIEEIAEQSNADSDRSRTEPNKNEKQHKLLNDEQNQVLSDKNNKHNSDESQNDKVGEDNGEYGNTGNYKQRIDDQGRPRTESQDKPRNEQGASQTGGQERNDDKNRLGRYSGVQHYKDGENRGGQKTSGYNATRRDNKARSRNRLRDKSRNEPELSRTQSQQRSDNKNRLGSYSGVQRYKDGENRGVQRTSGHSIPKRDEKGRSRIELRDKLRNEPELSRTQSRERNDNKNRLGSYSKVQHYKDGENRGGQKTSEYNAPKIDDKGRPHTESQDKSKNEPEPSQTQGRERNDNKNRLGSYSGVQRYKDGENRGGQRTSENIKPRRDDKGKSRTELQDKSKNEPELSLTQSRERSDNKNRLGNYRGVQRYKDGENRGGQRTSENNTPRRDDKGRPRNELRDKLKNGAEPSRTQVRERNDNKKRLESYSGVQRYKDEENRGGQRTSGYNALRRDDKDIQIKLDNENKKVIQHIYNNNKRKITKTNLKNIKLH